MKRLHLWMLEHDNQLTEKVKTLKKVILYFSLFAGALCILSVVSVIRGFMIHR